MLFVLATAAASSFAWAAAPPDSLTQTLPLINGQFTVSVKWTLNEFDDDVLLGDIAFAPSASLPSCARVSLIQAANVEVTPGQYYAWDSGQQARNQMRTPDGFYIDHDATHCQEGKPCEPYFQDYWNTPETHDGSIAASATPVSATPVSATMEDAPFGWDDFSRITLQTCAVCADPGKTRFYGCASWGGYWPNTGDRLIAPLAATETPSTSFLRALKNFDQYYANPASSP